jgi:hypothetical protein
MRCSVEPLRRDWILHQRALGFAGALAKYALKLWCWRTAYLQSRAMDVTMDSRRFVEINSG